MADRPPSAQARRQGAWELQPSRHLRDGKAAKDRGWIGREGGCHIDQPHTNPAQEDHPSIPARLWGKPGANLGTVLSESDLEPHSRGSHPPLGALGS